METAVKKYDVVVAGAGPAGSAAAAELAISGKKVLLVDRTSFPREKVCGGFVGSENRTWLEKKGLWQKFLAGGARPVNKLWMTSPGKVSLRMHFSEGRNGLAVKRSEFDKALVDLAVQSGAELKEASRIEGKNGETAWLFNIKTNSYESIQSKIWIDACGAFGKHASRLSAGLGVMAVFENVRWMKSQVVLHFAQGGHFGLNPISDQLTTACYVADNAMLKKAGGDLEKLFELFLYSNPFLRRQMGRARRVSPWRGIPVASLSKPKHFEEGWFFVGDAVSVVNPIVGGGMTMAIQSGLMLAGILNKNFSHPQVAAREYAWEWNKLFSMKSKLSHSWGWLSHRARAADMVLGIFSDQKKWFRSIFETYHPATDGALNAS